MGQNLTAAPDITDLVIEVIQTSEIFTDPNIFINFNEAKPSETSFSLRCSFYGEDICVIGGKELVQITYVTIGIPNDESISAVEIKGIGENKFSKFEMLMTKGNSLPTSENSLYLRPAWENGYVGKFSDDCSCFCKGCNYTVLVSVQDEGYIIVGSKVSGQVVDLTSAQGVTFDSVLYYHTQWYSYNITNPDQELRIKLDVFSGDPDIYVNPKQVPENIFAAAFNSKDHFENEELVLSPIDRGEQNKAGTYYIGVFGKTASTFKLSVYNSNHSIFIQTGLSESGYIGSKELKFFYFRDPILAEENIDIAFQLHVMTGVARLRAKLCEVSEFDNATEVQQKCFMTDQEMFEDDPNEKKMSHIGSESEKTNTSVCKIGKETQNLAQRWFGTKRARQVSCAYVIGLAGMAAYTTHYSILLKTQGKLDHIILKEGIPVNDEIQDNNAKYYMISIDDPLVTKLTIQMTTIHGDPDLFTSTKTKEPNYNDFEKRSIRCGIYPELVEYQVEFPKTNLIGEYYIAAFGYTQSTYHLVYFLQRKNGETTKIRLTQGIKQRAVLQNTQESKTFQFQISNHFEEEVEIKLHSENGQFTMLLGIDQVPDGNQYYFKGDEHNPIVFTSHNTSSEERMIQYYVKVFASQFSVVSSNQTQDSAGMAYVFTLAFYESLKTVHLSLGQPIRGKVTNETIDHYYFEVKEGDEEYEISLTPISGNPDLAISFHDFNMFPDEENHDMNSEKHFSTDTITISMDNLKNNSLQILPKNVYIGVYTNDPASSYTLLYSKTSDLFSPILLVNGQIQTGSVKVNSKQYYYFKTGSQMPIYATLVPKYGDPNMKITIIGDTSLPKQEWRKYKDLYLYSSEVQFGADLIYLNPDDPTFNNTCGYSCILLIIIENAGTQDSHYTLTVTRDIAELVENQKIMDGIMDFGQYKYYKFYKSCQNCDLEVQVTPFQLSEFLYLLVDFEVGNTLPTHQNQSKWFFNVKTQGSFVVRYNDSYFTRKFNSSSIGTFIIALHGHGNISYTLAVTTIQQKSTDYYQSLDSKKDSGYLDIRKIYLGENIPVALIPNKAKYFYFENWNNATLKFQYVVEGQRQSSVTHQQIDMRITTVAKKRLPKYQKDLMNNKWQSARDFSGSYNYLFKDLILANSSNSKINFCVQCYFVVSVENIDHSSNNATVIRLVVEQEELGLGFQTQIIVGRPYNVRLQSGQKANLQFQLGRLTDNQLQITAQIYNGQINMSLLKGEEVIETSSHTTIQGLFNRMVGVPTMYVNKTKLRPYQQYTLQIEAIKEDLHCNVIVMQQHDIFIIADGKKQGVMVYPEKGSYFLYIPPSRKFFLTIGAQSKDLNSSIDVFIKKYDVQHSEEIGSQQSYSSITNFDYNLTSKDPQTKYYNTIFQMIPIEMEDEDDLIIVKVTGEHLPQSLKSSNDFIQTELFLTGSEIQFIKSGETLRGIVNNRENNYLIYEFYVNQNELFEKEYGTDLYIEVTPCNGKIQFYVSEDFATLFNNRSYVSQVDIQQFEKFGKSVKRVKNIDDMKVIYIGIESINEVYSYFQKQGISVFDISVSLIKSNQQDIMEEYVFEKSNKGIYIDQHPENSKEVILKWNKIFKRSANSGSTLSISPLDNVSYTVILGKDINLKYQLGAQCQLEQIIHQNQSIQVFNLINTNSLALPVKTFEENAVVGILSYVQDTQGNINTLAYEPVDLRNPMQKVLVSQVDSESMYFMVIGGTVLIILLALVAVYLRRKGVLLDRRLQFEMAHATSQEMQTVDHSRNIQEDDS